MIRILQILVDVTIAAWAAVLICSGCVSITMGVFDDSETIRNVCTATMCATLITSLVLSPLCLLTWLSAVAQEIRWQYSMRTALLVMTTVAILLAIIAAGRH
jgi:hypothetical protein